MRGDNKSRMEYYKGGVTNGIFSINDCRAWEDLPPVEGGDEHFVQAQMVPVSVAAQQQVGMNTTQEDSDVPEDRSES